MNAAIVESFGAPPRYASFADPVPAEGEAIVTVTAAGLHQIVRSLANGSHYGSTGVLPFIPGIDGVGRLEDGTRVYFGAARSPFGTMAERCLSTPTFRFPLSDGIDDATAAGIANPAMSSWAALKLRAQFAPGESVLVLGATGASGKLALQIAKRMGASRVVAVGRNVEPLHLESLGADAVISLNQERDALLAAYRANRCDIVLDYLWGQPAEVLLEALSQRGLSHASSRTRFVQIGSMAGPNISLPAAALRSSGLELLGSGFGSASMEKLKQAIVEFFAEAAKSPFQFDVKVVPLSDVESQWNSESSARVVFRPAINPF